MKKTLWLCACLAGAAALHGAGDGIFRYDFGTKTSPLREGYVLVTPLKGYGYAWSTTEKLKAAENTILETQANKRRQSIEPPPVYFNTLSCDHVSGTGDAVLKLKVPSGPYRAVMICGHAGRAGGTSFVWNIQAGGLEINNWGKYAIRELIFPVQAGDDGVHITLKTKSAWLVNALLLEEVEEDPAAHHPPGAGAEMDQTAARPGLCPLPAGILRSGLPRGIPQKR